MQTPTIAQYGDFQAAYEHFNLSLFQGALPDVMFTLARTRHTNGHISPEGFSPRGQGDDVSARVAEISLNPETFLNRTAEQVLSTLAHEMVHYAQHIDKATPAGGYHNKDWAKRMKAIGLYPSSTGGEGGAETGVAMSHYIIPGAAFEIAAKELIGKGWALHYFAPKVTAEEQARKAARSSSKTKQTCPHCRANAWAKPGLELYCGNGHEPRRMVTEGE